MVELLKREEMFLTHVAGGLRAEPVKKGRIERAVRAVLASGLRTGDIALPGETAIGTRAMGTAVAAALSD